MNIFRTFMVALTALARTKTRSFLTVLGVIIGVGAVIAMVSIGEGAKARVAAQFEAMGTNTLIVSSGSTSAGGARGGAGSRMSLTWEDLAAVRALPEVALAAPQLRGNAQILSETSNWQTQVNATTPEWLEVRAWKVAAGDFFTTADVNAGRKVAVIGKTVAVNLFADEDPVGKTVRIDRTPFTVVGVLESKGTSAFGQDNDDVVVVPTKTYLSKVSRGNARYLAGQIMVTAAVDTTVTKGAIEELLRTRHKLRADAEDDFSVRDLTSVAKAQAESASTITSLLAGVALVSLLVGGIGIMNIMLVSVTERTREIGLRMAIGAKPGQVRMQFLIEALVLSVAGGLLGIVAGIVAGQYMANRFGFPLPIRPDIVVLAVGVSAAVGIAFGFFPAHRASRLDPITALRHE
ncbi:MAG: FtsX-like permease family protein [Kofleriaceae bacterium]|nr:MAG: FtsX-like permease family protein [Kofleriaceae bacterium]